MRVLLEPRFWLALFASTVSLSAAGLLAARMIVKDPPTYHRTGYFEFALPTNWSCKQEGTETVCRSRGEDHKDALIIFTAKYRNDQDTLAAYTRHLATGRSWTDRDGTSYVARVDSNRERTIGNYRWVDAVHYQSEVPYYYTRYLATVTTHIGVLITFTAHQSVAEQRFREFDRSVESLRIYQSPM